MILGVTADAVAGGDIIVQLLLKFAGNGVAIDRCSQVGPFQPFGENGRAFVGRAFAILVCLASFLGGTCVEFAFGFGGGRSLCPVGFACDGS